MTLLTPPPGFGSASASLPTSGEGDTAQAARIRKTAQDFEAAFLSEMYKPMFKGLATDGPFGGGDAEETWRSFMIDAMAKQTVKAGGIGLSDTIMAEMMKMQEQTA